VRTKRAAKWYFIPNRGVAKGVQLRLLQQREMTAQKAQAEVLLASTAFTTRYRGGTPRRRGAMRKTSSTAQPRQGRGLTATSMRTTALASAARRLDGRHLLWPWKRLTLALENITYNC
jgi:hypothetical protein